MNEPLSRPVMPMEALSPEQRDAAHLLRLIIRSYNGRGLFCGPERYHVLEQRLKIAAIQSQSLFDFCSRLIEKMCWDSPARKEDEAFLGAVTSSNQQGVLVALAQQSAMLVMVARYSLQDEVAA